MRLTIYVSIKYTALFCLILALMDLLGAKQANYAGCRHEKNLKVEIDQKEERGQGADRSVVWAMMRILPPGALSNDRKTL